LYADQRGRELLEGRRRRRRPDFDNVHVAQAKHLHGLGLAGTRGDPDVEALLCELKGDPLPQLLEAADQKNGVVT
jgi:hypothetical protein